MTAPTAERPLELLLGAWYFQLLVKGDPGLLPAEFFRYAAPSLLVCDRLVCDARAFEAHMNHRSGRHELLSTRLFRDLHDAGVLKAVSYEELLADPMRSYRALGLADLVRHRMEQHATRLREDDGPVPALPAALQRVNELLALELAAAGYVPYSWNEGPLGPTRATVAPPPAVAADATNVVAAVLPHVEVLPPPVHVRHRDPRGYRLFSRDRERQKRALHLWMSGDAAWSQERFLAFRSGAEFEAGDRAMDRLRERHARERLEAILAARERTAPYRHLLQQHVRFAIDGQQELADLREAALEHEALYRGLLPSRENYTMSVVVGGGGLLTSIASLTAEQLAPAASVVLGGMGVATSAAALRTAIRKHSRQRHAQRTEPLGWVFSEIGRTLATP